MISSQGMRTQPLAIVITTAGFLGAGFPLYDMRQTCIDVLKGNKCDETQFSALYELDAGDDWTDESVWEKSCPSLGHTVLKSYLREQVQSALNTPSLQVGVITKNFNCFVSSSDVWITDDVVAENMQFIDTERLDINEPCHIGVDLSSRGDLTAWSVLFPPNPHREYYPDKYLFKSFIYIPEKTLTIGTNAHFYQNAIKEGQLKRTSGNTVDYDEILKDMLEFMSNHYIVSVGYDTHNATQWAINAQTNALPIEPFSQNLLSFNAPTKEFERLLLSGNVIIDANIVTRQMFKNAVLKYDHNGNIKPVKSTKASKIDALISMIEALGMYLMQEQVSTGEVLFG